MRTKKTLGLVRPKLISRTRKTKPKTKNRKRIINQYKQLGGDKPSVNSLKYINVFDYENIAHNQCNKCLNPMYGFLWSLYLLDNFMEYTNYDIVGLMNMLFVNINGEIVPSNSKFIKSLNLTPYNIGLLLAYCYLFKNQKIDNLDDLNGINDKDKTNLKELLTNFKDKIKSLGTKINYSFNYQNNKQESGKKTVKGKISLKPNLIEDDLFYMVMLILLWWKCDNTSGISEYYSGLNSILSSSKNEYPEIQIFDGFIPFSYPENPEPFEDKELRKDRIIAEPNYNRKLEMYLAMTYKLCFPFKIISWGFVKDSVGREGVDVADIESIGDCIETTIRNLINILIYDSKNRVFNLELLINLGATQESSVYKFYETYNTMDSQSYEAARLSWLFDVVWNLDDVGYKFNKTKNGKPYKFELNCEHETEVSPVSSPKLNRNSSNNSNKYNHLIHKDNIIRVLRQLFNGNIKSWDDITTKIPGIKINNKLYIENNEIKGGILLTSRNVIYKIEMKQCHYEIKFDMKNYMSISAEDFEIPDFKFNDIDLDISIFLDTLFYIFKMFSWPVLKLSVLFKINKNIDYFYLHSLSIPKNSKIEFYNYILANLSEVSLEGLTKKNNKNLHTFLDYIYKQSDESSNYLQIRNDIDKIKSNLQKVYYKSKSINKA